MDAMKALLAFLTSCSLAAGFVVGYLEHVRSREAGETAVPEARRIPPPPPPPVEKKAPPKVEEKAPEPKAPREAPGPSDEEIARTIREVEDLLLKADLEAAGARAEDLIGKYRRTPGSERLVERLRRTERKIEAYRAIVSRLETRELPETLYRVELTNGGGFIAKTRKEGAQRYDFEPVLGGVSSMAKDRVKSVTPMVRTDYLTARWKEIQGAVAGRKDPYDLFYFGVKKCFRDGLCKEGIGLIDRLLAMADSAHIVALITDGQASRTWEEAAGRRALEEVHDEVEEPREVVDGKVDDGPDPVSDEVEEPEEDGMAVQVARVQELVQGAEAAYKTAGGNAEKIFQDVRIPLQAAAKLLFALSSSPDPKVADLRRRVGILLEKVMGG
jgi:hypothetical protein